MIYTTLLTLKSPNPPFGDIGDLGEMGDIVLTAIYRQTVLLLKNTNN
jgi:hypothetical protein